VVSESREERHGGLRLREVDPGWLCRD
jgi:hypothetical protein